MTTTITIVLGGAAGALTGGVVAYRLHQRNGDVHRDNDDDDDDDEFPEQRASRDAREWSEAHLMPEAERLIVNKLRLGWDLRQRRGTRGRSR